MKQPLPDYLRHCRPPPRKLPFPFRDWALVMLTLVLWMTVIKLAVDAF